MAEKSNTQTETDVLQKRLFEMPDFATFLETYENGFLNITFHQFLWEICKERDLVPEQVIKRAVIERTYGHQLFSGRRNPSRDKVIQLAFGLNLNWEETQTALKIAKKNPLYPKIKRDAAILFCLKNRVSFFETQNLLHTLRLPLLGEENAS